jgi:hypothetical protein
MEVDIINHEKSLDSFLIHKPTTISLFHGYFPKSVNSTHRSKPHQPEYSGDQIPDKSSQLSSIEDESLMNKSHNGKDKNYEKIRVEEEIHLYGDVIDETCVDVMSEGNRIIIVLFR